MERLGSRELTAGAERLRAAVSAKMTAGAEILLNRAELLEPEDRALLRLAFDRGASLGEVAAVMGASRGTVSRRINKLLARLQQPGFLHLYREDAELSPLTRRVAQAYYIGGLPQRAVAQRLGLSLHRIREQLTLFRGFCEARTRSGLSDGRRNGASSVRHED